MMDHALAWMDLRRSAPTRTAVVSTVLALTAIYQFLPLLHFFAPAQIFGKNIYTVIPAVVMIAVFLLLLPAIWRTPLTPMQAGGLLALAFVWLIVLASKTAMFGETVDFLRERYLLLFFIYSAVLRYIAVDPRSRNKLAALLIAATCAQAVFGILHTHFFPYLQVEPDTSGDLGITLAQDEGSGENGTLLVRSIFGDVLVCGQFLLLSERRMSFTMRAVLMGAMFYAVTLSGARYAQIWSALLTAGLFINRKMDRAAPVVLAAIVLAGIGMALTGWTPFELHSEFRTDQDSGGRGEKLGLVVQVLSNYWPLSAFIGVPQAAALTAVSATGTVISDDSYGEIVMDFGLPGLLLFMTCLLAWIVRWPMSILSTLMLIFLLGNFAITNSVYWDVWQFYFLAAWWLVYVETRKFKLGSPNAQTMVATGQ
jgi:hypothetical protein